MERRGALSSFRDDRQAVNDLAMAAQKSMLSEFAWDPRYRVSGAEDVLTPALVMYPEIVAANIERTVALLGGEPDRWRAHIKTAKLGYTVRMMVEDFQGQFDPALARVFQRCAPQFERIFGAMAD